MEILNESTFKKLIFLLICPLLIVSSIGSAAAELYIGEQSQEAGIIADNGVVSYTVDQDQSILSVPEQSTQDQSIQDQSAQELTENGAITQTQQGTVASHVTPGVVITDVRYSQTQSVDSPSTGDSANGNLGGTPSTDVKVLNTVDTGSIYLDPQQQREETTGDLYQAQTTFLKIIYIPTADRTLAIGISKQR